MKTSSFQKLVRIQLSVALFAASICADGDRHFSDNLNGFLENNLEWFGANSPKNFMNDLKIVTPLVFNNYFGGGSRHATKFNSWFGQIQRSLVRNVNRCMDLSGTKLEVARKRRAGSDRSIFSTHQLIGSAKKDFWAIFWGHATYVRETMLSNEKCNQRTAMRIMRRVDRMRLLVEWQYCDKVDPDYEQCSKIHKWNYSNASQGIQKGDDRPNPRNWDWFQEGGKYHKNFST